MATTSDDLLIDAQRQIWAAARTLLPPGGQGRSTAARETLDAQLGAWPGLAAGARHALLSTAPSEASVHGPDLTPYNEVLTALERAGSVAGRALRSTPPDEHFVRAGRLLAAAGDALRVAGGNAGGAAGHPGPADQVLAGIAAAARLTAVYAEQAARPERQAGTRAVWVELARTARQFIVTAPGERSTPRSAAPIPKPGEATLAGSLDRWRVAALDATEPTRAPTVRLPQVAAGLRTIHAAAAAVGGDPDQHAAATAWRTAVQPWAGPIRIPGPDNPDLRIATADLLSTLTTAVADHREGTLRAEDLAALTHFIANRGPGIAEAYDFAVRSAVHAELPVIAARRLAEDARPVPVQLAQAARQGRWVPLPATYGRAQAIVDATTAAAHTGAGAKTATAADPEAVEARRVSAAGSPRSLRDTLAEAADRQAPPPRVPAPDPDKPRRHAR